MHSEKAMVVVRLRKVVKGHGEGRAALRVLDGLDLDVAPGELVAVTGRSGSGKSTLLNVVGGLDRVDDGVVEVMGVRLDGEFSWIEARADWAPPRTLRRYATAAEVDDLSVPPPGEWIYAWAWDDEAAGRIRARVGFVFQAFHLLPELTGLENVLLPARLNGRGPALERGRELVERLGLGEAAERLPTVLSGGEQQRLAIARALVNDPQLVLADEPTGNLDAESGETVLSLLRGIADEGRAVLLVTHEQAATRRADRVLQLEDGRLR